MNPTPPPIPTGRPVFAVVVSEKGGVERREVFDRPEITVGRVQGNDLMLPKGNVSKKHLRLAYRESRFVVTDLNSTNGTYVNRRRITQATIVREGDRVYVGDFVLRLEAPEPADSNATAEAGSTGPAPRATPAAEDSQASFRLESEDARRYPDLPSPPRVPGPSLQPVPSPPAEAEPRPLHSLAATLSSATVGQPPATRTREMAIGKVVSRVVAELGPGALERELDATLEIRIVQLLEEKVRDLEDAGELPAGTSAATLGTDARNELIELGPLTALVDDPNVGDIVVSQGAVTAVRGGARAVVQPGFSSEEAVRWALTRACRRTGVPLAAGETVVERRLLAGGELWAAIGAAAPNGPVLVVRKSRRVQRSLDELVRQGTVSRAMATFLGQAIVGRASVLVVGRRDSGASAVVSALVHAAPAEDPWVVVEPLQEVVPPGRGEVRLALSRDPATAVATMRGASHARAARLLVEPTWPALVAGVVDALGEGTSGIVARVPAPDARHAVARLIADLMAARPTMSVTAARETIATSFDLVLEVVLQGDGRSRVTRLAEVAGTRGDEIALTDVFVFTPDRVAGGGAVDGSFHAVATPRFADDLAARGVAVDRAAFARTPSR
ncbi:MAG: Flp pilus assembly complex ATPase component TadA [Polyangiaceae bacterium]|nr:Flp pilus assembly complex ATPase component TadA [Polyangiaceae bacterium]